MGRRKKYSMMHDLKPSYVVTVKFGKEDFSIREIGDAVFPYDNNVLVAKTKFKGVLVLYTKLNYSDLLKVLSTYPPAYIERIVKVDFCCPVTEVIECTVDRLARIKLQYSSVKFGRIGSLGREKAKKIKEIFLKYRNPDCNKVLHVEPINDYVCFGLMEWNKDKFSTIRKKKVGGLVNR